MDVTASDGSLSPEKRQSGRGTVLLALLILLLSAGLLWFINHTSHRQAADLKTAEQRWQTQGQKAKQGPISGDLNIARLTATGADIKGDLQITGNVDIDGTLTVNGQPIPAPAPSNGTTGGGSKVINHFNTTNITNGGGTVDTSGFALLAGNQTFTGVNKLSNSGNVFVGDGSGLTGISASNITSGTLSDSRLSGNVTLQGNTFNGANQLVQLDGSGRLPAIDGSQLTNINAATLNGQPGSFYQNASNINTGTLSNARLNADVALLDRNSQVFTGNTQVFQNATDSTTAFQIQNAAGNSNLLVADTTNTRVGIGTASPNTTLSLYNGNESLTQTDLTQALTSGGLNIVTDFTDGAYTPGVFWSTQNNNSSKPKAGIYMFEDAASGTSLLFGTSGSYSTGITNTALRLGPSGEALFKNGANSSTAFQIQNTAGTSLLTVNTSTGAVLVNSLFVDNLGAAGSTSLCLNVSSQVSTCSGGGATDLQTAYNSGNSITTTSARDLSFNLADTATDSNFIINMLTGTTSKFQVQANGTPTFSIGPTGAVAFQNAVNSTSAFQIQNSSGGAPLLKADTVNATVGIGVSPTSTGGALQIGGAVSISQFNPTTFTTPNGAGVNTQINIPVGTQGSFSQLLAFGIGSGSSDTARVLSVFDARTVAHQPSLGVFSVNEANIVGFSWEGGSSIAYLKTTGGDLGLRSGTTDLLTLSSTGQLGLTGNARGINVAIGSGATSVGVTFPNAYAGSNYAVQCTPSYNTTCYVTGKSTTGFTINFGTAAPDANQTVDWLVVR